MRGPDNAKVLENGFAKGLRMIEDTLYNSMMSSAERLLIRVATNRQFIGFTGNTQTSYMAGIYVNGRLSGVIRQNNWNEPTVRMKVRKGKIVFLANPYEGHPRAVVGRVDVIENHGVQTSIKFLEGYRAPRNSICLVITTGTEYSEYIEQVMHLDVLTNTWNDAARIIEQNWKKIDSV